MPRKTEDEVRYWESKGPVPVGSRWE